MHCLFHVVPFAIHSSSSASRLNDLNTLLPITCIIRLMTYVAFTALGAFDVYCSGDQRLSMLQ